MNNKFYELNDDVSFSVCAENPTGEPGKAAMAEPLAGSAASRLGKGWKCKPFVTITPHGTIDLCDVKCSGEVVSMWIAGEVDRSLILRMFWDGCSVPSVECPLTDFFCYGWAQPLDIIDNHWNRGPLVNIDSSLISVAPNRGLSCFIPMPFRKRARICLENRSTNSKVVYYQLNFEKKSLPPSIAYFHAQFNMSFPVKYKDVHTILDSVEGNGKYIGTSLYVGLNRTSRWWGEGEFKFYIDGDSQYPSICTTGLEDYFLGAFNWDCEGEYREYSHLYSGMTLIRPDGQYEVQPRFSLYRWHICDPIHFRDRLHATVQALGWTKDDNGNSPYYLPREDDYCSVAYFYLDKPSCAMSGLPSHEILCERL